MKSLQFGVGLLAAVASLSLYAQTMNARANIPFEFRVGEKLMPAGEYFIQDSNGWLTLQESGGSHAAVGTLTYASDRISEKPVLQFNRYGDTYFFEKMSNPGFSARAVSKTRQEQELARRISPTQSTIAFKGK
jgi:hypothetical protein